MKSKLNQLQRHKNFLSEDEISFLLKQKVNKQTKIRHTTGRLKSILDRIQANFDPELLLNSEKSYCRLETRPKGHKWHKDTGSKNHMTWCKVGSSILLSDPSTFRGGEVLFKNGFKIREYNTLICYPADYEHMVTPHSNLTGGRFVFLAFWGGRDFGKV
jgi:hypothetical protein